jgi:hypothetical protein
VGSKGRSRPESNRGRPDSPSTLLRRGGIRTGSDNRYTTKPIEESRISMWLASIWSYFNLQLHWEAWQCLRSSVRTEWLWSLSLQGWQKTPKLLQKTFAQEQRRRRCSLDIELSCNSGTPAVQGPARHLQNDGIRSVKSRRVSEQTTSIDLASTRKTEDPVESAT